MSDTSSWDPYGHQRPAGRDAGDPELNAKDFDSLLRKAFEPKSDEAKEAVERSVRTLAEQALASAKLIGSDVRKSIEVIIAQLDKKLTEQVNEILHHEDFQNLEGRWRGLAAFVTRASSARVRVRVLNISRSELSKVLKKYTGATWNQSPLFKQLFDRACGDAGGEPFDCVIGDYYFDHSPPDVETLNSLALIMQAAQCVFIASAAPTLFQKQSWGGFEGLRYIRRLLGLPEYASWRSLREQDRSRYIALTLPRRLARGPYGSRDDRVEEFDFKEDLGGDDPSRYCWSNAAYELAVNIAHSYNVFGWGSRIRGLTSGGAVHGLPSYTFPTDDGGVGTRVGVETSITETHEAELSECGLIPLVQRHADSAVFVSARSLHRPVETDDAETNINAQLSARVPYVLACCHLAHQLAFVVRDKFQSVGDRSDLQAWLQTWLDAYVGAQDGAAGGTHAAKPLASGRVTVTESDDDPSRSLIEFTLRPRHQPNGLSVSVHLASEVRRPG